MTKNGKKLQLKNLILFGSKVAIYLHKGRASNMRNLQPSKENIQHFKT